jgi:mitochondrial fission protein ELM1
VQGNLDGSLAVSILTRPVLQRALALRPAWVLTDGHDGVAAQAIGLAEAMALAAEPRRLRATLPWAWLPGRFWHAPLARVRSLDAPLVPPWPTLAISCGRIAAPVAAALCRRGLPTVHLQDPGIDPALFDAVVAAEHDGLTGPNVIVARHAMHRVTPERLAAAAATWAPRLRHLRRPLVSVLVGGPNGRHGLDAALADRLGAQLAAMARQDGVGLVVTASRSTPVRVREALAARLEGLSAEVWSGEGENPYLGILALADAIIVIGDSVSLLSEAAATAAPLLIPDLPGRSRRVGRLVALLKGSGRARSFQGRLETWPVEPVNDTPRVAAELRGRLGI